MGYSCAAISSITLDACISILKARLGDDGGSNTFGDASKDGAFFEQSMTEHVDGSITGKVMRCNGNQCSFGGSVKIDGEGKVVRFPGMTKAEKAQAEQAAEEVFFLTYVERPEDKAKPMFEVIN